MAVAPSEVSFAKNIALQQTCSKPPTPTPPTRKPPPIPTSKDDSVLSFKQELDVVAGDEVYGKKHGSFPPITATSPVMMADQKRGNGQEQLKTTTHLRIPGNVPIVHLQPGTAQSHVFDNNQLSVRFHTRNMHIEVSHEQAKVLASGSALAGSCSQRASIRLVGLWLEKKQALSVLEGFDEAVVDMNEGWDTLEPRKDVLFSPTGLLIRKNEQVVQLRATYEGEGLSTE